MRINKLSKSDSFDLYTQTLSNFLIKKEAQEKINKLVKLASGLSRLFDLMVGGSRTISKGVDTTEAAGRMADNIRQGELYSEIQNLRNVDGIIDNNHPMYLEVFGKISREIEAGSRELAEAYVNSGRYSPKMIELFFGSQDNLARLYQLFYISKYMNSGDPGLKVIGEFPGFHVLKSNLATGLNSALPIVKDENMELLERAALRTSTGGFDFLRSEPEDLAQLRSWLDADPTDVARVVEEGRNVTRPPDAPEEVTTVRQPEATEDVPTTRPQDAPEEVPTTTLTDPPLEDIPTGPAKTPEELAEAADDLADAGKLTDDDALNALREEFAKLARDLQKEIKDLNEKLEARTITQAQYDDLMKVLKEKGIKLEKTSNKFVEKLKAAGAAAWAITTWSNIGKVGALAAIGIGAVAGYNYLTGDSPSTPAVDPSETPSARQSDRVTIDPQMVAVERAFGEGDSQAIQDILSDPDINEETLKFITNKYRKDKYYELPQPYAGMKYVFLNEYINPTKVSETLGQILQLLNSNEGSEFFGDWDEERSINSQEALNEAVDTILRKDLWTERRLRRERKMKLKNTNKPKLRRRKIRKRSEDAKNEDRLQKLSHLKEISITSTNNNSNNDTNMLKKADEVSKSYVKDAVKGLNHEDKTLREYFTGLGRLYDAESEKRNPDYEELYKLHNETGRDLTLSAHPKAIRVSDGLGNGGLVENGLEQKEKLEEVALSTPTGNFKSRYAKLENLLKKSSKT